MKRKKCICVCAEREREELESISEERGLPPTSCPSLFYLLFCFLLYFYQFVKIYLWNKKCILFALRERERETGEYLRGEGRSPPHSLLTHFYLLFCFLLFVVFLQFAKMYL